MQVIDYVVLAVFFVLVTLIGWIAVRRVAGSQDYFVAGGKIPWWLGGISHHVSGHSGVVFVAYAGVAYQYGFTLYVWWAGSIILACAAGARWFAPRWARLRQARQIESPTEYLALRYSLPTQQLMAWSGILLKLFDVGAKWASIGVLLHGFTGLPVTTGIWLSGGLALFYTTVGGLWADLYTDLLLFAVQVVATLVLLVAVLHHLGGLDGLLGIWDRLPAGHGQLFNGPYTPLFLAGYIGVSMLSYNGGTWNLAVRYIGAKSPASARQSAWFSGALYLVWPLFLFFPMWAAPLLLPNLADPNQCYILLTQQFLPAGLVGLVLASMFAATMAMVTSDMNTISSVITRDILPVAARRFRDLDQRAILPVARWSTLVFTVGTLVIGAEAERFGGVLGLVISWFAALIGPVSVPMLLGLLPAFQRADARAAIGSILGGFAAFVAVTYCFRVSEAVHVAAPIGTALGAFCLLTWLNRHRAVPAPIADLMTSLAGDARRAPSS